MLYCYLLRMPSSCIVCRKTASQVGKNVSMYRFPSDPAKRQLWLTSLNLNGRDIKEHHRVCSRHFPNGDTSQVPSTTVYGERFARKCIYLVVNEQSEIHRKSKY